MHLVSKYFMKKKYSIYFFNDEKVYELKKINELDSIKKLKHKGYNFFTTKSLFFKKNLQKICL